MKQLPLNQRWMNHEQVLHMDEHQLNHEEALHMDEHVADVDVPTELHFTEAMKI